MSWKEKLSSLPTIQGRREAQEPFATDIILEFMCEEVYPMFKASQAGFADELRSNVSPELATEISSDAPSVCLSIRKRMNGSEFKYSLQVKHQVGFDIHLEHDRKGESPVLVTIALDREPESPAVLIESYLKDFIDQFIEG